MSLLSIPNYHGSLAYVTAAAGPEQAAASTTWFQRQREGCTGQKHTTTAFVFSVEAPTSSEEQLMWEGDFPLSIPSYLV